MAVAHLVSRATCVVDQEAHARAPPLRLTPQLVWKRSAANDCAALRSCVAGLMRDPSTTSAPAGVASTEALSP